MSAMPKEIHIKFRELKTFVQFFIQIIQMALRRDFEKGYAKGSFK